MPAASGKRQTISQTLSDIQDEVPCFKKSYHENPASSTKTFGIIEMP
jgi:hypothetical protein